MGTQAYTPKNENFEQVVRESFALQGLMETLGAELTDVGPGKCEITMPFKNGITQQHGYVHAGAISSIADSSAGYAAFTLSALDHTVLTTEYKIHLLAPARGEKFVARAKVIKSGKTLQVVSSEVFAVANGIETQCALLIATIMNVARPERNDNVRK